MYRIGCVLFTVLHPDLEGEVMFALRALLHVLKLPLSFLRWVGRCYSFRQNREALLVWLATLLILLMSAMVVGVMSDAPARDKRLMLEEAHERECKSKGGFWYTNCHPGICLQIIKVGE